MIPLDVRNQGLMLARPTHMRPAEHVRQLHGSGDWLFEPKWDGIRCLAVVERGRVTLRGRAGTDITGRYPEVVAALAETYPDADVVFDGELICFDANRVPQFSLVHRRDAQSKPATIRRLAAEHPATYVAFDVLYDDEDLRGRPQAVRSQHLEMMATFGDWPNGSLQQTVSTGAGKRLWEMAERHRLEGVVAKRRTAPYRAGRGGDWIKLKLKKTASVWVTGVDPGQGWRESTFGALHMTLWDGDQDVPVGSVGSGFSERELNQVCAHIRSGRPLVIEVEYLNVLTTGEGTVLRQPVFLGIRTDISPHECTIEQLELERA